MLKKYIIFFCRKEKIPKSGIIFPKSGICIEKNCAYDAANRWKPGKKTVINTKLFIMLIPIIIISIYCLIEILYISITAQTDFRIDGLLCVYFLTIFVALIDIVSCFAQEMALRDCISKE